MPGRLDRGRFPRRGATGAGTGGSGTTGRGSRPPAATGSAGPGELVFVDDATSASAPPADSSLRSSPLTLPGLPRRSRGRRRHAGPGGSGSRLLPLVGAVVVLGLVIGVAVALTPSHHAPPAHQSTKKPKTSVRTTDPPPTTTPPQVQPTSSTAITADYGAPATGYTVGLQATGPCWVLATTPSTGAVVWTGTLAAGQTRSIPATGNLLLRLGAANDVSVTLNGEPVVFPTGFHSPFDMSFQAT